MAVSAEMPRLQPCPSVSVPTPRKGFAAPGCRPPLTRLQAGNFRARFFGGARFPRFLAAIDRSSAAGQVSLFEGLLKTGRCLLTNAYPAAGALILLSFDLSVAA
jgi:hypothetical protein